MKNLLIVTLSVSLMYALLTRNEVTETTSIDKKLDVENKTNTVETELVHSPPTNHDILVRMPVEEESEQDNEHIDKEDISIRYLGRCFQTSEASLIEIREVTFTPDYEVRLKYTNIDNPGGGALDEEQLDGFEEVDCKEAYAAQMINKDESEKVEDSNEKDVQE